MHTKKRSVNGQQIRTPLSFTSACVHYAIRKVSLPVHNAYGHGNWLPRCTSVPTVPRMRVLATASVLGRELYKSRTVKALSAQKCAVPKLLGSPLIPFLVFLW